LSETPPTDLIEWTHVAPLAKWTVVVVLAALGAFENGDIGSAASLADAMLRDPQIAGDLSARVRKIASRSALPFVVEESDEGDGRRRAPVAKRTAELWWHVHPESTIAAIERDSIMLGVAVGWIEWLRDATEWIPRLHHLPAHGLRFDDSDKTWRYSDGKGDEHIVTPGDGKWFLHLPHGPRSWLMGAIRSLGIPFALDPIVLKAFTQFCQRHGLPVLVVDEPFSATDNVEGEGGDSDVAFYTKVQRGLAGGMLRAPQPGDKETPGWKARWLELQSKSYTAMADLITELRRRKSLALTGRDSEQNGSLGGDGELGSRQVSTEGLSSSTETLSTTLREHVWKPFSLFNYGDPRLAAWGRWDTRPPTDLASRATTLKTASEALAALEAQGVDTDVVVREFGLQRRSGWKPPDLNAPPPAPPTEPAATDPAPAKDANAEAA